MPARTRRRVSVVAATLAIGRPIRIGLVLFSLRHLFDEGKIRTDSTFVPTTTEPESLSAGGDTVAVKALSGGRRPQSHHHERDVGNAGEIGAQQVTLIVQPVFSQSGRFHKKRDFGGKPKSL